MPSEERKLVSPTGAVSGTEEFDRETAVMDALPHAIHPMHDNWRTKADALIKGLEQRGWHIVRAGS